MRFPDFLIIGAMKSGTTTLFEDLSTLPGVFFPSDKEPGNLAEEDVLSSQGRARYAALFESAHPTQTCGDASTVYAKLPDIEGCASRAFAVLKSTTKIVYLVREPLSRAVSQYKHEIGMRTISGSIDEAVVKYPRLIDYSCYAMQLAPWIDRFGKRNVLVVRFEDYVSDREEWVRNVATFLGINSDSIAVDPNARFNESSDKVVAIGLAAKFINSRVYRSLIRPYFSRSARQKVARMVLPRPRVDFSAPTPATVEIMCRRIVPDVARLQEMLALREPLWNLDDARIKIQS